MKVVKEKKGNWLLHQCREKTYKKGWILFAFPLWYRMYHNPPSMMDLSLAVYAPDDVTSFMLVGVVGIYTFFSSFVLLCKVRAFARYDELC